MADGIVQVPPDSTGKKVDAASIDVGANAVYRQRVIIGDNSASGQFALVTGGALTVAGTMNISAMPTVTVTGGVGISGTATVVGSVGATVTGLVGLTAGASNIGFINHISASVAVTGNFSATSTVVLAAGAANIGDINAISRTVQVAIATPFTVNNISAAVVLAAGTANIGAVSNAAGTALMGAVSLAAGTANIGFINNISATVNTSTLITGFQDPSGNTRNVVDSVNLALRVNVVAGSGGGPTQVSLAAGTSNIGFLNNISATVNTAAIIGGFRDASGDLRNLVDSANLALRVNVVAGAGAGANPVSIAAGTSNIGFINNISATVIVAGVVSLAAGTSNIGTINDISRTVQVAIATPFTVNNISATVNTVIGAGTSNIGNINHISRTVEVTISTPFTVNNISATVSTIISGFRDPSGDIRNLVDSANLALRVNVVAGAGAGANPVSIAAGTSNIGFINNISATVIIAGVVSLAAGQILDSISKTVNVAFVGGISLAAGTANIGFINNISATVTIAGNVNLSLTANVVVGAGVANIGFINNISATVTVAGVVNISAMPATTGLVGLTAGTSVIGDINAISRTVQVAIATPFTVNNISATVNTVLGAGTSNIGNINHISRTVEVTVSTPFTVNNISATVNAAVVIGSFRDPSGDLRNLVDSANLALRVNVVAGAGAGANPVSIAAGTSNIGFINNISATVIVAGVISLGAGTNLIGAVSIAAGTSNIGFINNISATVNIVGVVSLVAGTTVNVTFAGTQGVDFISRTVSVICSAQMDHGASVTIGVVPVQMGLRANLSAPAAVASADATFAWADRFGRQLVILNHPSLLPSVSHGPRCVTVSTSVGVALIAAPGAGLSVYITKIACTNGSSTLTRGDVFQISATTSCVCQMYMAASGGGFTMDYNPPIQFLSNSGVTCRIKPNTSKALFNVHYYVGAK